MSEQKPGSLKWREKTTGREIEWPWPVSGTVHVAQSLSKDTPVGEMVLHSFIFGDAGYGAVLLHPQGARFMRISPETDWALEERKEGTTPPEIAADIDFAWRHHVDTFAAGNKELRESEAPRV
jgi:hypothetical protein